MRSRIRSAILVGATVSTLAVALSGCTPPDEGTGPAEGEITLETLHFVNPLPSTPLWAEFGQCMGEQAAANDLDYTESGPSAAQAGDATVMIQQIQDAVAQGKDAIVTFPLSAAFGPVLLDAQEQGIITGTVYGDGTPESGATVNGGVDWGIIGEQYVEAMAAQGGDQYIGLVAEGPTGVGKSWIDGVKAAAEKTDNVHIVAEVFIGADSAKAVSETTSMLIAYPEITLVASNTGVMTAGAVSAIDTLGLQDEVRILAINNANGGPEALKDGHAIGLYLQDLCQLAKDIVDGVVRAAGGEEVGTVLVNAEFATVENVDELIEQGWG
jgi:ABC-type sugar transport system substrate-binding protein